jgi:FtsZ-binding cell division protein ZapB
MEKPDPAQDEWKVRYFNDMEMRDKEISAIKENLMEAEENARIYSLEAKEMFRQKRALEGEMAAMQKVVPVKTDKERSNDDYLEQLRQTQIGLVEQNQKINQLLGNIDLIKEKEELQREILRSNEELSTQVGNLRAQLTEKEKEINHIRQKEQLTNEMKSMLDNTYHEFNTLQGKIHKLESQLNASRMMNMEYEDLKEAHSRMTSDFEDHKMKVNALTNDNQHLQKQLVDVEDKLREASFQRQQLQKRTAYLEELNRDLQVVSDTNKKLESQLRRVGELENMLNVVSEERPVDSQRSITNH